ncbi:hypothetical protein BGX38DRAFT_1223477 [Terfezia claveryi]|nr:hypothetical protein BGX38DRAFT_1223477 [Terfezia claveryi]
MSSDNQNITPRLAAVAIELRGAESILREAEIELVMHKDEAITLMEKLPNILLAIERELREIKDLPKHEEDAFFLEALEDIVGQTRSSMRYVEGLIEKLEKK